MSSTIPWVGSLQSQPTKRTKATTSMLQGGGSTFNLDHNLTALSLQFLCCRHKGYRSLHRLMAPIKQNAFDLISKVFNSFNTLQKCK